MTIPRWAAILFLCVSFLGFLDATYLAIEHYRGVIPPCSIVEGCDTVLASDYAKVFGVPVALFGALYYLFVFLSALFYLDRGSLMALRMASWGTIAGFLSSLWFLYVQFFILHAVCLYCIFSAGTSITLFTLGMWFLKKIRRSTSV